MPRMTNEDLANLIGGVDDGVVGLKGKVGKLDSKVDGLDGKVDELKKVVDAANGRQRGDHDTVLELKGNQDNCPARKAASNPGGDDSVVSIAKWGLRQYGVYGIQFLMIIGLLAVVLRMQGII